jgi:plastocyanin
MRKLVLMFALASIASLALVACGGGSDNTTATTTETGGGAGATTTTGGGGGGGGGASSSVNLAASPTEIAYDTKSLTAKAGNITIDFNNPNSGLGHDVCVQTTDGSELGCSPVVTGKSTTLDLQNVKAGNYEFFCSVDSHADLGMKGTLTVQ